MLELLAVTALLLAAIPALLVAINLRVYRRPAPAASGTKLSGMSVLIPARDEEAGIGAAVAAALDQPGVDVEVLVMDDHSTDRTASIVRELARDDPRVRLASAPALPHGWCGKQHACQRLADLSSKPLLVFIDADVRLQRGALARAAGALAASGADLISGVPYQRTVGALERLVVPLIHFVLLGFLPVSHMRRSTRPAFAAGCGQLFVARREAYFRSGGHAAIQASRHDGIALPRAFRRAGLSTDLFDATATASCRMYRSAAEVWRGFAKNATEGMAAPGAIVPWTILLGGGQVLPFLLLAALPAAGVGGLALICSAAAVLLALFARSMLAWRFRQRLIDVVFHPVGVALVLAIQWYARIRQWRGHAVAWKGRVPVEG